MFKPSSYQTKISTARRNLQVCALPTLADFPAFNLEHERTPEKVVVMPKARRRFGENISPERLLLCSGSRLGASPAKKVGQEAKQILGVWGQSPRLLRADPRRADQRRLPRQPSSSLPKTAGLSGQVVYGSTLRLKTPLCGSPWLSDGNPGMSSLVAVPW